MSWIEYTVIGLIVLAAVYFMARRTWKKYKGAGGGCGSGSRKAKNVSLTIGGQSVRRR